MIDSAMKNSGLSELRQAQRNRVSEKQKYWLRLTNACNNNCIFCLDSVAQDGTCRDTDEIAREMRKAVSEGAKKLILSGGDPAIHPEFIKITALAGKMGYEDIQVITNGRMFCYRKFLEDTLSGGVTEITFSFHGHTKALYEKNSGIRGSYEQALAGLYNALGAKKLVVNIDVVINRTNYRYLEDILRFFIGLGVNEFDLLQVVPFGKAWENRDKVLYDVEKALPYLKRAFALQEEFPNIYIWTNRFPAQYLEGHEELIQHPLKLYDEIRGRKGLFSGFIERGRIMSCFGERCRYCFLRMFCRDLIELKRRRVISGRKPAACLVSACARPRDFRAAGGIDIKRFLDFFIKQRYFLKGAGCIRCRDFKKCAGAPIDLIRENGFKILNRIT